MLDSCHPAQRGFVEDPGRRIAALTARGCGKTTGCRARLVRRMLLTPRAKCLYVATTRSQAIDLMWAPLKDVVERTGVDAVFNETRLSCRFPRNGSQLRLVGADDKREIEKLRGLPFHEVDIDEGASYPAQLLEHLLFRIIGPRLGDYGGCLCVVGTPGHVPAGPFYDATRPGSDIARPWSLREAPEYAGWQRWSTHSWTLLDGAPFVQALSNLWREALVEKEANGWSDQHPVWRREFLGQWAADDTENVFKYRPHDENGQPLNQWDPPRDKYGFAVLPEGDWRFVIGMDMGHSDPFALEVFAYLPTDPTLWHVYEFNKRGMYARTIAQVLLGDDLSALLTGGVLGRTGWPEALVADTAGLGEAMLDELRNVYGIRVQAAAKKDKFDAIELSNGDLLDGRVRVLKGSVLEAQMMDLQWSVDDFGHLKENKGQRNDCTDAFVYARRHAFNQFTEAAKVVRPAAGTPQLADLEMAEAEAAEAAPKEDWLADPNFAEEFLN